MLHFIAYHPWILLALIPIILIDLTLKLIALWKSAHNIIHFAFPNTQINKAKEKFKILTSSVGAKYY